MPSPNKIFSAAMATLPRDLSKFVFVDFGCGKGSGMLHASSYSYKSIIGVEFSPELATIGKKNLEIYKSKTGDGRLAIQEGDATQFEIPGEKCVLYFFNPFTVEVSSIVFERITASWRAYPRPIYVIWCFVTEAVEPMFRTMEFVPHAGSFAPGPPWIDKGFIVFRSQDAPPDFIAALGKSVSSPDLVAIIKKYSLTRFQQSSPARLRYANADDGMNVVIDRDLVTSIRIYAQHLDGFKPYEHVWPCRIRPTMSRRDLHQLLGEPEFEDLFSIRYCRPEFGATLELRFDPADRLESLDIITRI